MSEKVKVCGTTPPVGVGPEEAFSPSFRMGLGPWHSDAGIRFWDTRTYMRTILGSQVAAVKECEEGED